MGTQYFAAGFLGVRPQPEALTPKFGWGGRDAKGAPRAMPTGYRLNVDHLDLTGGKEPVLTQAFVNRLYEQVFRNRLDQPGFAIVSGLGKLVGNDMQKVRRVQADLARRLAVRRAAALGLTGNQGFTFKYLGRSNKTKLNPIHSDTKARDSIILMAYEPSRNVRGYPFIADLAQYARDKNIPADTLMKTGTDLKAHYGNQLRPEHTDEVLDAYSYDLSSLNPEEVELVVVNDSITDAARGMAHGVRHLEFTGPDPQRNFNHVVIDIADGRKSDVRYFAKGTPEAGQKPVTMPRAEADYIERGTIWYRKDSNRK